MTIRELAPGAAVDPAVATPITIVAGSFPPDNCGIADYTWQLLSALRAAGVDADCYHSRDWSLRSLLTHWRALRGSRRVLLLEYPALGFERKLAPFLLWGLLWRRSRVVAMHEFSVKKPIGKLLCLVFFAASAHVIFTNANEQRRAIGLAPWLRRRSSVIHIGSNIPFVYDHAAGDRTEGNRAIGDWKKNIDVVYFGLIMPGKGVEEFVSIMADVVARRSVRVELIGKIPSGSEAFAAEVIAKVKNMGGRITLDAEPLAVAQKLAAATIVLLPFPDGISARRGSALAAMGNGALVVTTSPAEENAEAERFGHCCLMSSSWRELSHLVCSALDDPYQYDSYRAAARQYAQQFEWSDIADAHVRVMRALF